MTLSREQYRPIAHYEHPQRQADSGLAFSDSQLNEPPRPYGCFQQLQTGIVTCRPASDCAHPPANRRPTLELTGQWLANAGFVTGSSCIIEVYRGMLIVVLDQANVAAQHDD